MNQAREENAEEQGKCSRKKPSQSKQKFSCQGAVIVIYSCSQLSGESSGDDESGCKPSIVW